jgi:hypothetical protein
MSIRHYNLCSAKGNSIEQESLERSGPIHLSYRIYLSEQMTEPLRTLSNRIDRSCQPITSICSECAVGDNAQMRAL